MNKPYHPPGFYINQLNISLACVHIHYKTLDFWVFIKYINLFLLCHKKTSENIKSLHSNNCRSNSEIPQTSPWNSSGQTTGVGSLSLLQWIFPTQGSNPGLPHCTRILHQLSHKRRPDNWDRAQRFPTSQATDRVNALKSRKNSH